MNARIGGIDFKDGVATADKEYVAAVNIRAGVITNPAVAGAFPDLPGA